MQMGKRDKEKIEYGNKGAMPEERLGNKRHHELSPAAIVIGVLISVLFGAANAYLGLKVGLTISASM